MQAAQSYYMEMQAWTWGSGRVLFFHQPAWLHCPGSIGLQFLLAICSTNEWNGIHFTVLLVPSMWSRGCVIPLNLGAFALLLYWGSSCGDSGRSHLPVASMPIAGPPSGNVYHEPSCCQVHLASNATCVFRTLCIVMSSEEWLRHILILRPSGSMDEVSQLICSEEDVSDFGITGLHRHTAHL